MESKLTSELIEKAKETKTPEELLTLAKENGVEMTEESAKAYFDELHKTGEISDDELDNVSGGCTTYHNGRPVITSEHICDHWNCENCHRVSVDRSGEFWVKCRMCGSIVKCGNCEYSRYEDLLLLCYHPKRYNN